MPFHTRSPQWKTKEGDTLIFPFGPPIFATDISDEFKNELLEEGNKLTIKDDFNWRLAGNLKYGRSYHYDENYVRSVEPKLKVYVEKMFNGLIDMYGKDYDMVWKNCRVQTGELAQADRKFRDGDVKLDSLWINYGKKHDFNPPHTHHGILSFVIFLQVPQKIFDVQADCNTQRAGFITFQHGNHTKWNGTDYPVRPADNMMLMFPADLPHYVSPYWVDETRISMSGNFVVL